MKPKTRDNIIYLTVGLSIAALLVADVFYTDSHGRKMWFPSRFAFRSVYTTVLLWYFVLKGIRQTKLTFVQMLAWLLSATLMHLTIVFASRQIIEELPGIAFAALGPWELYFVFFITEKFALYLTRTRH
jgi:hypothetical protein